MSDTEKTVERLIRKHLNGNFVYTATRIKGTNKICLVCTDGFIPMKTREAITRQIAQGKKPHSRLFATVKKSNEKMVSTIGYKWEDVKKSPKPVKYHIFASIGEQGENNKPLNISYTYTTKRGY